MMAGRTIFVANDSVRQSLYQQQGDGTFADVALTAGAGYDENGKTFAGMGIDCADYDNDGWPECFYSTLSNETYPLFHNNGDLTSAGPQILPASGKYLCCIQVGARILSR